MRQRRPGITVENGLTQQWGLIVLADLPRHKTLAVRERSPNAALTADLKVWSLRDYSPMGWQRTTQWRDQFSRSATGVRAGEANEINASLRASARHEDQLVEITNNKTTVSSSSAHSEH